MSYQQYEDSLDQGEPIEIYEFTQGLRRWTYVSGAQPVLYESQEYSPSPIKRDRIKQTTDRRKDSLKLTFPRSDSFANQYIGFAPEEQTTVTIRRAHRGDPDEEFVVYWKGRVVGAKATENTIEIECESVFTSIRRPGLRARYELTCRHTLYGRACSVNREAFKHEGTVLSVNGPNMTVEGAGSFADGYFTGGILLSPTGATRFITAHTSDDIQLSRPLDTNIANQTVEIYPGCDHLKETCKNKFNNLPNFGGFPHIPVRNPFDGSSIV